MADGKRGGAKINQYIFATICATQVEAEQQNQNQILLHHDKIPVTFVNVMYTTLMPMNLFLILKIWQIYPLHKTL